MDELLTVINDAAASGNWLVLAFAVVLLAVPIVLKALKKPVPIVDQLIPVLVGLLKRFRKDPPPEQKPEAQGGIAAVVPIESARKPEEPK